MFTGIITDLGRVRRLGGDPEARLAIDTAYDTAAIPLGTSVACSGVCLTVVDRGPGWLAFDVSAETLARTTIGSWTSGRAVNLERALRLGDEFGGHIVGGHVDAAARIVERQKVGGSLLLRVAAPHGLARFIAAKGSVALDGVSLTVNDVVDGVESCTFAVNIVPHTRERTTLGQIKPGAAVNVEIDMLARYVARITGGP
ncbi:MAG: riboflavin synthase [Rhodospirillaceae bacterium]|nr:riboflavin synthase [Rhodospirillaceae bacterium]